MNDPFALGYWHYQSGRLAEAEVLLRQVLSSAPKHAGALHLLGLIAFQSGRCDEAATRFRQAVALAPSEATYHSSLGAANQMLKRFAEARASHEESIRLEPANPTFLSNLGIALESLGEREQATAKFREACQLKPRDPTMLLNLGVALNLQENFTEAETCLRQVLETLPYSPQAYNSLAESLRGQGRLAEALICFKNALQVDPAYSRAAVGVAKCLHECGQIEAALVAYQQALQMDPTNLEVCCRMAEAFLTSGQPTQALLSCCDAVRLNPKNADARNYMGNTYVALGQNVEAVGCYHEALRLDPRHPSARCNLGLALLEQGRLSEAQACLRAVVEHSPTDFLAHSAYLVARLNDPRVGPAELLDEHRGWASRHGPAPMPAPPPHDKNPARPLRIGYLWPDPRSLSLGPFLEPILAAHDRKRFETIVYGDGPAPKRMKASGWHTIQATTDEALAEQIRADGIDILVELSGHLHPTRLRSCARKPAPIQVSYLGYPGTTGLAAIDYRLGDAVTDPESEAEPYVEKLFRLNHLCCYAPPSNAPAVGPGPAEQLGKITFGALVRPGKLHTVLLDLWALILQAVPKSRLLLGHPTLHGSTAERIAGEFQQRRIPATRLELRKVEENEAARLAVYHEIDLVLDPFPWNDLSGAFEALWMGVPVLALQGDRHGARTTASILDSLELPQLIAERPEHCVRAASVWAGAAARRKGLRAELRQRLQNSPLCDAAAFTRDLEASFRAMWNRSATV